ncbi:ATP-dependent DNA helicase [Aliikangiella marina]|uniref:DNA 5'-3' helicase n=1 Tax=Aliikangiella marina TaxID=1712262 RepID=A0A545TJU8_9GAMM|nr:ATP-dependent DNA helicase [Aliikangiella marina]TQV77495.1 ATP-dependent DNA helicase [Aliikangiella marina]
MSESNIDIRYYLGESGPFAKHNPKFKPREEQQAMAQAVHDAIVNGENLLVEAGTGVGKTFAYLLPALLSEKQVVISTGTKNLQDQLFKRDLPALLKILEISPQVALLKGRNNYLCEYRLESTLASGRLPDPRAVKHLGLVNLWREKTTSGDLGELSPLPEDSPVIPFVTSTSDNCLGQDCPFFDKCFLAGARERARKAQVLVVNHHLLLADLVLKEDGFGELLPDTDVFVIDEAHHLAKTAYQFYGEAVSSRQLNELCRELELEYRTQVTDVKDLMLDAQRLAKQVKEFRLALPEFDSREDWNPNHLVEKEFNELVIKINKLYEVVKVNSTRTKVLESCFERLMAIRHTLNRFKSSSQTDDNNHQVNAKSDEEGGLFAGARINWFETMKSGFRLNTTPLNVANLFTQSRQRYAQSSWIMTSATLSVDESFKHYIDALGWGEVKTLNLPSSFDYPNQSLLYVPRGLPSARSPQHTDRVIESILPLLQMVQGRAFVLFTSHRALKNGAELLKAVNQFECLVQGEASKAELLKRFIETPNSVLLATGSFWEGVDVSGDALVLVVIDKLPFAPPDDPILNAKMAECKSQGGNPFFELQIPEAVLSLKQGCGRLIRSVNDKGVVVICDPRLVGKQYGEIFVNSLPDMRRTRELRLVEAFLADIIPANSSI